MKKQYKGIGINTSKNTHETVFSFVSGIDRPATVLDIPCGRGAFTQRLKDHNYKVTSSDIVTDLFTLDDAPFVCSNLNETLPFSDNAFQAVTCIDGIAHVENIPHTLREFNRVLAENGSLIISTPNISSLRSRFRYFLTGFHNKRKMPLSEVNPTPEHLINIIDFPMLRYFLHTNNFEIVGIKTNQKKAVSWLYGLCVPFTFLFTLYVFKTERHDKAQGKNNSRILKSLFSRNLLFGETMIVHARKKDGFRMGAPRS